MMYLIFAIIFFVTYMYLSSKNKELLLRKDTIDVGDSIEIVMICLITSIFWPISAFVIAGIIFLMKDKMKFK